MKPAISVCIPLFNVEKYVEKCLKSVFEQTIIQDVEVILVNDCSTDNTMAVVSKVINSYSHLQSQITIINHNNNLGLAAARNSALEKAQGQYIIHIDSDDWCEPNYLETMYCTIKKENADICICDFFLEKINLSQEIHQTCTAFTNIDFMKALFSTLSIPLWTKLVKTSLYHDHNIKWIPDVNRGEDFIISLKLFFYAKKIILSPVALYHYRYNIGFTTKMNLAALTEQDMLKIAAIEQFFFQENISDLFYSEISLKKAELRYHYILASNDVNRFSKVYPELKLKILLQKTEYRSLLKKIFIWSIDSHHYFISRLFIYFNNTFRKKA